MSEQEEALTAMAKEEHKVTNESADWLSEKLKEAMALIEQSTKKITLTNDDGEEKIYTPVAVRVDIFRRVFGIRGRIITRPRENNQKEVVMESFIDFLMDGKYVRYANAFAGKTQYEAVSAQTGKSMIQLAETASIGRALANIGLSGGEFSSLEDLVDFNNEKVTTSNMKATKIQIKKIEDGLKAKNLNLQDAFPLVDDINKIDYQKAREMIREIDKMDIKKTTRSRTKRASTAKPTEGSSNIKSTKESDSSKTETSKKNKKDDGSLF